MNVAVTWIRFFVCRSSSAVAEICFLRSNIIDSQSILLAPVVPLSSKKPLHGLEGVVGVDGAFTELRVGLSGNAGGLQIRTFSQRLRTATLSFYSQEQELFLLV